MTESAIRTVVSNFAKGMAGAGNAQTGNIGRLAPLTPAFGVVAPQALSTVQINQSIGPYRVSCTGGGYHETLGRITGSFDVDSGFGNLSMQGTQTINDYRCMQAGWAINGDPYISFNGSFSMTGQRASMSLGQFLGWRATNLNTGAAFSCQNNIRVLWDDRTGGHVTGRVDCSPPSITVPIDLTF